MEPPDLGGRTTDRAREQVGDVILEHLIGGQPDRVFVPLGFKERVDLRVCEGGIGAEVAADVALPVAGNAGCQNVPPAIGGMDVAGTEGTALQIAELVEDEQRVIASTAEMAVVGCALLPAVGRADAGIHIEHNDLRRPTAMNTVDPPAGQIGECGKVLARG